MTRTLNMLVALTPEQKAQVIKRCEQEFGCCVMTHSRKRLGDCTPENCSIFRKAVEEQEK